MEERQATPALQEFPQLGRLPFFRAQNQGFIADYLAHLRARHYAPSMQEATLRALKSFAVLMPQVRQAVLYEDLTQTTPADIDAWIEASFPQQLAPGTIETRLRVVQGVFTFWRAQGHVAQSPMRRPRHQILGPQDLPRPMAEDEGVAFFRVSDALRDRTRFLLRRRGGLRVGEVSSFPWTAIDFAPGTVRLADRKGHVDRGVSLSPDVATALRQWQGLQAAAAQYVFPSRVTCRGKTSLTARHMRNRMACSLKLAGSAGTSSPHALRHTFATQLRKAGAALEVVKALMGHRSIQATLRSTQLYDRTKRAPYAQAMAAGEKRQRLQGR
jgi:site-specific recombinase XerD